MNKKANYIAVLTLLTPAISKSIMNNFINRQITNYKLQPQLFPEGHFVIKFIHTVFMVSLKCCTVWRGSALLL